MTVPNWSDPNVRIGTMARAALWLISEVRLGGIFTKDQLRQAFPDVAQVDRRVRDLRSYGWVIHTNREDAVLRSDEQKFVRAGVEVWNRSAGVARGATISAKARRAAFIDAGYLCECCGITAGEMYSESPGVTAVLSVVRSQPTEGDAGADGPSLSVRCRVCHAGGRSGLAGRDLFE